MFWGWEEIWDIGRKIGIIKVSDHDDAAPAMEMEIEYGASSSQYKRKEQGN